MAARTEKAALLAHQWKVAMADGAEEHGSSLAEVRCGEGMADFSSRIADRLR
jgi:hypothetical protein